MKYNYSVTVINENADLVYSANAELSYYYSRKKHQANIFMAIIQIDPIVNYLKDTIDKNFFYIHIEGSQYVIKAKIKRIHKISQEWHYEIIGDVTEETIANYMKRIVFKRNKRITMLLSEKKVPDTLRRLTF